MEKWVTQSYQENRDFYNCLNRKLPATQISARLTAVAERREIKCAFILKALCTHELTFSGLWCEVGKCCCFRWRNWGRRLVCPILLHGWGWVLTGSLCLGSHHSHSLTWCDTSLALSCRTARPDILIEWIFHGSWSWKMLYIRCLKVHWGGWVGLFGFLPFSPLPSYFWPKIVPFAGIKKSNNWLISFTVLQS